MKLSELLMIWSDTPAVSTLIWLILILVAMYLGRSSAHKLINAATGLLNSVMKFTSESLVSLEQRIAKRNKQVILHEGSEATERAIEREFYRVSSIVAQDLSAYPTVQRKITDAINQIEADYQASNETPPSPPEWLEAVEAISNIQGNGDSAVDRILESIKDSLEQAHKDTLRAFRKSSLVRLQVMKKMLPSWRGLSQTVSHMNKSVTDLGERADFIDTQMQQYEKIRAEDDKVARLLTSSSLTQFFVAGLVLVIAILGGVINFQLIALPMSEMVGGTSEIGGWRTADIAAMVIIMVEVAMGLFLLESLRITHLFPLIGSMDDKMRRRMMIVALSILTILATVEASLAYMRDLLAMDREVLTQSLAGVVVTNAEFRWIPSIGQMVMGFILPFALAFVAIPLESFVHSSRTVIGLVVAGVIRTLAYIVSMAGQATEQAGNIIGYAYDMIIFLPLAMEQWARQIKDVRKTDSVEDVYDVDETVGGSKL
ncbi:MAG TPA: hypothetical protein ENI65_01605 [Gammaproteobacteria bacterium]|nr:hypothetical protein [Gammaproteobacteria bacterium]